MKKALSREDFNDQFKLGVATSSYQIEGAVDADGRGQSIWDLFCRVDGAVKNGDTGDVACDHYHRLAQDVELLSWLGVDAYRFSIAWPRVLPEGRGRVNQKGLDFYDRLIDALLEKEIDPCATLYHWDLPAALEGGWLNRATVDAFCEFAEAVAKQLGDRVVMWFTQNEPWCQAFLGYEQGLFAPGHRDFGEGLTAAHHLLLSHGLATRTLKEYVEAPIGPALNFMPAMPLRDNASDRAAARRQDGYFNRWFADPVAGRGYPEDMLTLYGGLMPTFPASDLDIIAEPIDVLGINYYERCIVTSAEGGVLRLEHCDRPGEHTADREIYPQGIYEMLKRMHAEYGFDNLVITENGAAYHDVLSDAGDVEDPGRVNFFKAHLAEMRRAQQDGIPANGYFAWSLMDNFEWCEGYDMRYGIVHVDFETQKRTPKSSAHFLKSLSTAPRK